MMRALVLVVFILPMLGACARDYDPCPPGSMKSPAADRCVAIDNLGPDAAMPLEAGPVGPPGPTQDAASRPELDASNDGSLVPMHDATVDAEIDADMLDAEVTDAGRHDGSTAPGDASPPGDAGIAPGDANTASGDAGTAPGDASSEPDAFAGDAGPDAAPPLVCSEGDVDAWRAFHLSEKLTSAIADCFAADPGCRTGNCALDGCLREKAGVSACESCVASETECMLSNCLGACGSSGTDASCRACACEKGCVGAFDGCSGALLDVCADCDGTSCSQMSALPAEQIMVVVNQLLFGAGM